MLLTTCERFRTQFFFFLPFVTHLGFCASNSNLSPLSLLFISPFVGCFVLLKLPWFHQKDLFQVYFLFSKITYKSWPQIDILKLLYIIIPWRFRHKSIKKLINFEIFISTNNIFLNIKYFPSQNFLLRKIIF